MLNKIKNWVYFNRPMITNRKKLDKFFISSMDSFERVRKLGNWDLASQVINELEQLRADTWNQDKITKIQNLLRNKFEIKNY